MTRALAVLALVMLGACSSGGTSPVLTIIKDTVLPPKDEDTPAPTGSGLTREIIEAYGLALIRARIEGEEISNILTGTSLNDKYVTYVSPFRQTITMLGGLVTSTRGLGGDLLSVSHDVGDPITTPVPLESWPSTLTRAYRFPAVGPEGDVQRVTCELTQDTPTTLTQVEVTYAVTPITEACSNDNIAFTNTYLAETLTGQIWKAQQWVGADVGYLNIDVLEPLTFE